MNDYRAGNKREQKAIKRLEEEADDVPDVAPKLRKSAITENQPNLLNALIRIGTNWRCSQWSSLI